MTATIPPGADLLAQLRDEDRIAFTYAEPVTGPPGTSPGC